jgi:hypothetical protein
LSLALAMLEQQSISLVHQLFTEQEAEAEATQLPLALVALVFQAVVLVMVEITLRELLAPQTAVVVAAAVEQEVPLVEQAALA